MAACRIDGKDVYRKDMGFKFGILKGTDHTE